MFPCLSTQGINKKLVVATDNEVVVWNHDIYLNDMCLATQKRQSSVCCYIWFFTKLKQNCYQNCWILYCDNHDCSFLKNSFYRRVMVRLWQMKSINFILIHETVSHLGQLTWNGLTFFHILRGCDTTYLDT